MKSKSNNITRRNFLRNAALTTSFAASAPIAAAVTVNKQETKLKKLPHEVWIASVSQEGITASSSEDMVNRLLNILESKMIYQPDIVCLPETFPTANVSAMFTAEEKVLAGKYALEQFSEFARRFNCYVICPVVTSRNGQKYNSGVVIDRKGERIGEYHKIHLTENEIANGLTPGPLDPPVFKTDFGVIGIQICFDILWENSWAKLEEQEADIVFWPSAYGGGQAINNKVWNHRYIVVSSTRKGASKICDINGTEPAVTGFWDKNFLCAPVNLNKVFLHSWPYIRRFDDIKRKYGRNVQITTFHEEEWSVLESLSPEIKVKHIMEEFEMKSFRQHKKSAEIAQIAARNNS